jgi:ketosteroid isomerase-like protein
VATNRERLMTVVEALGRGDIETVQAQCHPEAELRPTIMAIDSRAFRGDHLIADWLAFVGEVWDDYGMEFGDVLAETEDKIVFSATQTGRAKASGAPLAELRYVVYVFKDGLIWRATGYATEEEAFAAAGISS